MERQKDEPAFAELSPQTITMMTAEHANLQAGRFMTVSEANGRTTLFIGTVSGALKTSFMRAASISFATSIWNTLRRCNLTLSLQPMMRVASHYSM